MDWYATQWCDTHRDAMCHFIKIWFTRLWLFWVGLIYPTRVLEVCEIECDLPDFRFLQSRKYATNSYLRARRFRPSSFADQKSKRNLVIKPSKIHPKSIWDIDSRRKFHVDFDSGVRLAQNLQKLLVVDDFLFELSLFLPFWYFLLP